MAFLTCAIYVEHMTHVYKFISSEQMELLKQLVNSHLKDSIAEADYRGIASSKVAHARRAYRNVIRRAYTRHQNNICTLIRMYMHRVNRDRAEIDAGKYRFDSLN